MKNSVNVLTHQLESFSSSVKEQNVLVWPDGFVDEIIDVVETRLSPDEYTPIASLTQLAKVIRTFANHSGNLELVTRQKRYGGNGPHFAGAISQFKVPTSLIGCLGPPPDAIHPVFHPLKNRCRLITVGEPGHTDALEFQDGKLMLGKHTPLHALTWDTIQKWIPREQLITLLEKASLFVQVNWVMIPHMETIWDHLLANIFPSLRQNMNNLQRQMYIDLCDPTKRRKSELQTAFHQISRFQNYFAVTLGLNEHEAILAARALEIPESRLQNKDELAVVLRRELGIQAVTIHRTTDATACEYTKGHETIATMEGFFTPTPHILTGAGDHYNAGYCLGILNQWSLKTRLLLGVATSGAFVRTGKSPTIPVLIAMIKKRGKLT